MSDDKLDFLDESTEAAAVEAEAEAPEPEQPEAVKATPEPEAAPQEDEPKAEGTGETKAGPPPAGEEKQSFIPVTALLDEREKRQKAEREAEALRQWRAQVEAQQRQGQKKPDFFDNPDQAVQQALVATKVQQSRFFAERDFGAETVNEAMAYFDLHPQHTQQFLSHPSPFHAAVEFYKRQKFLDEVKDPDEWRNAERERLKQELMAELQAAPPQPSASKAPPPSMAKAPATGRDAIAPGNAFESLFG